MNQEYLNIRGEQYVLEISRYVVYGNTSVVLQSVDPFGGYIKLSSNISAVLPKGHFAVKTYSENADIWEDAFASGLFEDTGKRVEQGYAVFPIWKLKERRYD